MCANIPLSTYFTQLEKLTTPTVTHERKQRSITSNKTWISTNDSCEETQINFRFLEDLRSD